MIAMSGMAGECGNRTHPTLRSKVTVILKITEATRPHPPPFVSFHFDRNFSPISDFPNTYGAGNSRKIVGGPRAVHGNEKATGCLGIVKNRPVFIASFLPADKVTQIFGVPFCAISPEARPQRLAGALQHRHGIEIQTERDFARPGDV